MEKSAIQGAYVDFVREKGRRPRSVRAFTQHLGIEEASFYAHFVSFLAIEQAQMRTYFDQTRELLLSEPVYAQYAAREKLLAVFYTWFETLKADRSFVVYLYQHAHWGYLFGGDYLAEVEKPFLKLLREIIEEGLDTQEIADRLFLTARYRQAYWWQARFLIRFWVRDKSPDFQQTDAAVEKLVNFSADLIQPNALDSGFDLIKFFFRNG